MDLVRQRRRQRVTSEAIPLGLIADGSAIITGGAVTATAVPVPLAALIAPLVLLLSAGLMLALLSLRWWPAPG